MCVIFQDAIAIELQQSVCVKYANFLYSQGNYDDAIMYLEDSLKQCVDSEDIVFGGLEKVPIYFNFCILTLCL